METAQAAFVYLAPLLALALGALLGLGLERFLLPRVQALARRTRWKVDESLLVSLRGSLFLWSLSLGFYVAILLTPIGARTLNLVRKGLFVVVALSVTAVVARLAEVSLRAYTARTDGASPATSMFHNLTRLLVFLIGILIILQALGVAITPILTALGVGGLAVALALQETLANLFGGLQILASRQVRVGDHVQLDTGEVGRVADINWRNTTIRDRPDNLIIVPNAKLASAVITNLDRPERAVLVHVDVGVGYDSDLDRVEQVTFDVAREVQQECPGAVRDFRPQVRFKTLGDFSVNFTAVLRAREFEARELVRHEFIKRLLGRYRSEEIEIPFPVRTVLVKDSLREPVARR